MEAPVEEQDGGLPSQEDSKGSRGQYVPTTFEFSGQLSAADADSEPVFNGRAPISVSKQFGIHPAQPCPGRARNNSGNDRFGEVRFAARTPVKIAGGLFVQSRYSDVIAHGRAGSPGRFDAPRDRTDPIAGVSTPH